MAWSMVPPLAYWKFIAVRIHMKVPTWTTPAMKPATPPRKALPEALERTWFGVEKRGAQCACREQARIASGAQRALVPSVPAREQRRSAVRARF